MSYDVITCVYAEDCILGVIQELEDMEGVVPSKEIQLPKVFSQRRDSFLEVFHGVQKDRPQTFT